jgi:hypothetical protein
VTDGAATMLGAGTVIPTVVARTVPAGASAVVTSARPHDAADAKHPAGVVVVVVGVVLWSGVDVVVGGVVVVVVAVAVAAAVVVVAVSVVVAFGVVSVDVVVGGVVVVAVADGDVGVLVVVVLVVVGSIVVSAVVAGGRGGVLLLLVVSPTLLIGATVLSGATLPSPPPGLFVARAVASEWAEAELVGSVVVARTGCVDLAPSDPTP